MSTIVFNVPPHRSPPLLQTTSAPRHCPSPSPAAAAWPAMSPASRNHQCRHRRWAAYPTPSWHYNSNNNNNSSNRSKSNSSRKQQWPSWASRTQGSTLPPGTPSTTPCRHAVVASPRALCWPVALAWMASVRCSGCRPSYKQTRLKWLSGKRESPRHAA